MQKGRYIQDRSTSIGAYFNVTLSLSLSSLLFCKAFAPLSSLLNSPSYGYTTNTRTTFHLFYMDDLETFGKHDQGQTGLLIIVKGFSDDIQMAFGLDKCSEATFKTGKQEKEIGMYDFPVADCTHEHNVCPYISSITFEKTNGGLCRNSWVQEPLHRNMKPIVSSL